MPSAPKSLRPEAEECMGPLSPGRSDWGLARGGFPPKDVAIIAMAYGSLLRAKQIFVDQFAEDVSGKDVDLLNSGSLIAGHTDAMIDQAA
jgi:hypothetical protein